MRRVHYFDTVRRWADAFGWEYLRVRVLDPAYLLNRDLIDDLLAVPAPAQHPVKSRAFPIPAQQQVDRGSDECHRHQHQVARIIEEHLELEHPEVAEKSPALI